MKPWDIQFYELNAINTVIFQPIQFLTSGKGNRQPTVLGSEWYITLLIQLYHGGARSHILNAIEMHGYWCNCMFSINNSLQVLILKFTSLACIPHHSIFRLIGNWTQGLTDTTWQVIHICRLHNICHSQDKKKTIAIFFCIFY